MSTYVAERYLPGVTTEQLLDAAHRRMFRAVDMVSSPFPAGLPAGVHVRSSEATCTAGTIRS